MATLEASMIIASNWQHSHPPRYPLIRHGFLLKAKMADLSDSQRRLLFGGAMTIGCVPESWLDTEQYMDIAHQPVPDNQELLVEPLLDGATRQKPVIVFVDLQEEVEGSFDDKVKSHVEDILDRLGHPQARERATQARAEPVQASALAEDDPKVVAGCVCEALSSTELLTVVVISVPRAHTDIVLSAVSRSDRECLDVRAAASSLRVLDWSLFGENLKSG
jgi:hypothetical protein